MNLPSTERWRSNVGLILVLLFGARGVNGQAPGEASQPTGSLPTTSQPQTTGVKDSAAKRFRQTLWSDQKAIWTSPFHLNEGHAAAFAAIPLIVGTGALIAVDKDAAKWLPNTPDQVKWSKRVSQFGAAYTLGGVVSGMMLIGKKKDEPEIFNTGRSSARALVDALIVGYGLKYTTARERPDDNNGQGRFWKGSDSFPSGHVIDSWAVTTVIVKSRSPKWLKITSLTIATAVSLSRWGAQRHFPSDILAGGVMGGLIGNFVANRANEDRMARP